MTAIQEKITPLDLPSVHDKLINPLQAAILSKQARQLGRDVVMAHGVFDLFHVGHLRHLETARREGDILIVSLTADAFVNKGPDQPVFPALMRAEILASLEIVDWVVINDAASAVPMLNTIKPTVYIKGAEYTNAEDDITGKITDEKHAVEKNGGRIIFTNDIVFSSSTLINNYLDIYDPPLREYLHTARSNHIQDDIINSIESVADYRVLVVGDAIIDEYQHVASMGKSAKENMIATRHMERELFAGGVFAAANHVAGLCAEVEIVTCLGSDDSHEDLIRENLKPNIKLHPFYRPDAPTTRKCRFVEKPYLRKMFEVYFFDDEPLPVTLQQQIDSYITNTADDFDLVIVTDFGHGLIAESTINTLVDNARFLAVNAQTNSANHGYNLVTKYPKADYICIDAPEARLAVADKYSDIDNVICERLSQQVNCPNIIVTHGNAGCITYRQGTQAHHIPAFTGNVIDTVGAGDAFLSITSPIVAAGTPLELAGFIGNAAGALKVGIVGHRKSIEKPQLIKCVTSLLK